MGVTTLGGLWVTTLTFGTLNLHTNFSIFFIVPSEGVVAVPSFAKDSCPCFHENLNYRLWLDCLAIASFPVTKDTLAESSGYRVKARTKTSESEEWTSPLDYVMLR